VLVSGRHTGVTSHSRQFRPVFAAACCRHNEHAARLAERIDCLLALRLALRLAVPVCFLQEPLDAARLPLAARLGAVPPVGAFGGTA
jgi:hypothetical protein